jgi:hypothetical protein
MGLDGKTNSQALYIHNLVRSFLGDVESLRETFDTVVPILLQQDKERRHSFRKAQRILATGAPDSVSGESSHTEEANIPQLLDAAKVVRESAHKLRRSRVLFQGNSIVSLVSRFDQFFAEILRFSLRQRPDRLESLSLSYIDVTRASSIGELRSRFVIKEVEDQMRESHTKQFKYLAAFTGDFDEPKLWAPFIVIT